MPASTPRPTLAADDDAGPPIVALSLGRQETPMTDRSFAKAGIVALVLAVAGLPSYPAIVSAAPLRDGGTVLAQQDQGTAGDQAAGEATGQSASDEEALDNGPAFTNEPSPTAGETSQTPAGQPPNDIETLDNGPAATNEPPISATETAAPAAAAPVSGGQAPTAGQPPAAPGEAAAPPPAQAPEMSAAQFFAMPHSCVVAQAGRAYAAVNCDPNMQVQVGFAPLGGPPPFSVSSGSTNGTMGVPQVAPPPAAGPAPTPTPESSSTGSAQSNSPTTKKGSKTSANGGGASTQSSEPVVTFSGPQGTVRRVGNATIVTGASQDSQQQSVHNANGKSQTSSQSGESNQKAGNLAALNHAGKKHGKHGNGKKHGKHKKHKHKNNHKKNNKSKKNNGKSKKSAGKRSGGTASAGNGGSAHAEANGGAIVIGGDRVGGDDATSGSAKTRTANGD
jgi:hypothetical protein